MYESPINRIYQDIETQIVQRDERLIVEGIQKQNIFVDKEELIKALKYDRNQYSKGYKDGVNDTLNKIGHCKDCKYFEYNHVEKVDGIPLIVAHEICSKWGEGCKTKEDGYCFLFEPKEEEK